MDECDRMPSTGTGHVTGCRPVRTIVPGQDATFLRRAFAVARRAQTHGNHPFGAILVGPGGEVLIEHENGYLPDRDMTAHAERLLATQASRTLAPQVLAR